MKHADWNIIPHINKRYDELKMEMSGIKGCANFSSSGTIRKAIIFDLLQIGELVNRLSKELQEAVGEENSAAVVGLRNHIVHGCGEIDDAIVYAYINEELPGFIKSINDKGIALYHKQVRALIGKNVIVEIDRPLGYNHDGVVYELNYGYINGFVAPDGELQDAYIIDVGEPIITKTEGIVVAISHRLNDSEDKILVATKEKRYSDEELKRLVYFQEKYFDFRIIH